MHKGGVWLGLGDSITAGSQLSASQLYGTYPAIVSKSISTTYGTLRLINKAISGWKSADFLTTPSYWNRVKADLITLHIGTNDCGNSIATATFQANLEQTVDMMRRLNPNAEIILCSISRRGDAFANSLDPYRAVVTTVATGKGTLLCRFEDAWLQTDTATYTAADLLHPNAAGQQKLADVLWPVIQQTNFVQSLIN